MQLNQGDTFQIMGPDGQPIQVQVGPGESPETAAEQEPPQEEPEQPFDPGRQGPKLILPTMVRRPSSGPQGAIGRNDPCPCGSGKKFKQCCGRQA
jgi:preprotein translocase subunit SecA